MNKLEKRLLEISLFIFLTLVIMNSIKFISIVTSIGSIGKLFFCLLFIGCVVFFTDKEKIKIKFLRQKEWIIIISFLLLFTIYFILTTNTSINLLANLAFPIYFVFYYFLVKLFIRANKIRLDLDIQKIITFQILSVFRKTLFINFLLWFTIAIASGVNMFEIDGGFGGFFQDEIHFGFYVVTGFLISFYFRFNEISKDKSYFNLALLLVYGGMATLTSRNAFLIIVIALFYYFVISKIKNRFYKIFLFTATVIGANTYLIIQDLSKAKIIEITSGRYQIWLLALEKTFNTGSLFIGNGLFNLNDIILKENIGIGFYYLDTLDTLSFHSSYLEIFAGGGIIVLICFFRIVSKTWKLLTRINKSIIAGILIGATFESYLVQPFMLIASLFYFILISNNTVIKLRLKKNKQHFNISAIGH